MPTRARWLLAALCGWTVFVWGNRLSNAWTSTTESTSTKVVSTVLAGSFLLFAVAGVVVLVRSWAGPVSRRTSTFLWAFAGWTVAVWAVRIVAILLADHSVAFTVVHIALGLVSMALALGVARTLRHAPTGSLSTVG